MDVPLANQTLLFVVGFFQGPSLLPTTHNKVTTISDLFYSQIFYAGMKSDYRASPRKHVCLLLFD